MERKNVILADNSREEMASYALGLEDATGEPWEVLVCRANGGRRGKWGNLLRYGKYFLFSFHIFRQRRRYGAIVGWQAFYGLIFALWCRVFRVKKENFLVVKNLTYREKRGLVGWIYYRFMRFIVKSGYVDLFTCCSQSHCGYCAEIFEQPMEKFCFVPFGVEDVRKETEKGDYILSIGRSNRDWDFLIHALGGQKMPVRIVCDELRRENLPENVRIYNHVWGEEALEFLSRCRLVVIPILDGKVAAGETVLLQAMCLGKPVVVARPGGKWEEYIKNGENGFVVPKDREALRLAVGRLWNEDGLYDKISQNCRKSYEERFSLRGYGRRVGETVKEMQDGKAGERGDPGVWDGEISGCVHRERCEAELQGSGNSAH